MGDMLTLAPAASPVGMLMAELTECQAASARAVTQQARQDEGHSYCCTPSCTPPGLTAGKRGISAGILIITGAVIEQRSEAAHTSGILHQCLGRAQAATPTQPAGRERGDHGTIPALAAAAAVTWTWVLPVKLLFRFLFWF